MNQKANEIKRKDKTYQRPNEKNRKIKRDCPHSRAPQRDSVKRANG